eukprot:3955923-Prymnesium_polylepis.3
MKPLYSVASIQRMISGQRTGESGEDGLAMPVKRHVTEILFIAVRRGTTPFPLSCAREMNTSCLLRSREWRVARGRWSKNVYARSIQLGPEEGVTRGATKT